MGYNAVRFAHGFRFFERKRNHLFFIQIYSKFLKGEGL